MTRDVTFTVKTIGFDENYSPAPGTRLTTNFANLARGESRQENLRNVLQMIDRRFNALAEWDNVKGDRYTVELIIVSVEMTIEEQNGTFPAIELLKTTLFDRKMNVKYDGIVGNNFSSYIRDYDFSILLPEHNQGRSGFSVPEDFGAVHGRLFQAFVASDVYKAHFPKDPVICLSVSENRTYTRTTNRHPVLGTEYIPDKASLTETYFGKMGMQGRYFLPPGATAPLAFYFFGDVLNAYTALELIGTISTMETFQKIYRPEIYNANSVAGQCYTPSLQNPDYSNTRVVYDRKERTRLAIEQGQFTNTHLITPYKAFLDRWSNQYAS